MTEPLLIGLASIIILGIAAQWLAWRIHLPAILLLLISGFLAGPVAGFLKPDDLLGDLLHPIISLSVAIILLEGGLSLKISELKTTGNVVRNLISIGAIVTWLLSSFFAHVILGLELSLSLLLGCFLVVTGPTVIVPMLRHIRPIGRVSSILKWEGILIDPVGAMMAILVFEAILLNKLQQAPFLVVFGVLKTAFIGGTAGLLSGFIIVQLFKRYWVPDFLQNPVTLILALGSYAVSNFFQAESGLLTVTVMGIYLGNQQSVSIKHIIEFKENVRVLLISSIFVLLSAKLQITDLTSQSWKVLVFLAFLILIVRPASVVLSTIGSRLNFKEKIFLSCIAPRGIIAAAVSSVLGLRLVEAGYTEAGQLVPLTFIVIIGTVAIYGLTASPIARLLKLSDPNPQGVLIVGAHSWARRIGMALKSRNFRVLLVDTNRKSIAVARMEGLEAYHGNILSENFLFENQLSRIGRLLALSSNDEINSLAVLHFSDIFGRSEVYQLPPFGKETIPQHFRGRLLFGETIAYEYLSNRFALGSVIKVTKITKTFSYNTFQRLYGKNTIPLFLIDEDGDLKIFTADDPLEIETGQILISIVHPLKEKKPPPK